jgi:NaMN:DMB phosphoribosyltransferase
MFIPGETIIGKTSGAIATVSNLTYPEITKNEGDILYVENKSPIIRTTEQTDNLHLVIEF